jgi:hypothetical protein
MSIAFRLYQPHVHHGEDEVATPDLMVSRMGVALAGTVRPVSVERLTTAVVVPEPVGRCWGAPAAVVAGSSGGALISVGAVHGDLRCLDADPDLALQAGAKVMSRFAWRLSDAAANAQGITLKLIEGQHPEGTLRGEWSLSSLAAEHPALEDMLAGRYSLQKGELIFFAAEHFFAMEHWRQISLEHPVRRPIVHEYRIHGITAPLTDGGAT